MFANEPLVQHFGGCHCGAVTFEVAAPADLLAHECNCSICALTRYLHLIVPASNFTLLGGADELIEYAFNTGIARHLFCRNCGVKSFYVPRSNPDGISINVRCLNPETVATVEVRSFDGRNWEATAATLAGLSKRSGGSDKKPDYAPEAGEPDE
jgi:hypothetical protein